MWDMTTPSLLMRPFNVLDYHSHHLQTATDRSRLLSRYLCGRLKLFHLMYYRDEGSAFQYCQGLIPIPEETPAKMCEAISYGTKKIGIHDKKNLRDKTKFLEKEDFPHGHVITGPASHKNTQKNSSRGVRSQTP